MTNRSKKIRRRRLVALTAFAGVVASGCGADTQVVARPDANGEIVINMDEFSYSIDLIELHPGEEVTFVLVNQGTNEHEFMIGRNLQHTPEGYPNAFEHDFFETTTPMVDPPSAGMNMGAMDMGAMDTGGDGHDAAGDMPADGSMDMSGDGTPTTMAGDMPADGSMDMSGDGTPTTMAGDMPADGSMDTAPDGHTGEGDGGMDMGGDSHSGFMVQRKAGEVARITLTVPDDVLGEWQIGCFRGRGSHWDAGMRARLIVTEA